MEPTWAEHFSSALMPDIDRKGEENHSYCTFRWHFKAKTKVFSLSFVFKKKNTAYFSSMTLKSQKKKPVYAHQVCTIITGEWDFKNMSCTSGSYLNPYMCTFSH